MKTILKTFFIELRKNNRDIFSYKDDSGNIKHEFINRYILAKRKASKIKEYITFILKMEVKTWTLTKQSKR